MLIAAWVCGLLGALLLADALAPRIRLPLPTVQILLGLLAGFGVSTLELESGLRWQHFHDLAIYVLLPLLVFSAAIHIDHRELRRCLTLVLTLAIVMVAVTALGVAAAVYIGIDHPRGFPIEAALLTGVLLAATDPGAVTSQSTGSRADVILEGESLFNDGTTVALFAVLVTIALTGSSVSDAPAQLLVDVGQVFAMEFLGGLALGLLVGVLARWPLRRARRTDHLRWWLLLIAFGLYHAALALHVSGIISILVAGLLIAPVAPRDNLIRTADKTANGALFLLAGFTVTLSMFTERWLAMIIGIAAVLLVRYAATIGVLSLASTAMRPRMSFGERSKVALFGLRGAITLALVLSLPTDLPYWWTIQSIVYGVVLFDFVVLAPIAMRLKP